MRKTAVEFTCEKSGVTVRISRERTGPNHHVVVHVEGHAVRRVSADEVDAQTGEPTDEFVLYVARALHDRGRPLNSEVQAVRSEITHFFNARPSR